VREHYTGQTLNAALDTTAGVFLQAQHGGRAQAAAALAEAENADRAWRREQAIRLAERFPGRYASIDDAMIAIPDPQGGQGAWLEGDTDDIVRAVRRVAPFAPVRNLGESGPEPGRAVAGGPDGRLTLADTRAPWQRD
jgi:hypothetical protein